MKHKNIERVKRKMTTLEFYEKVGKNLERLVEMKCSECGDKESRQVFGMVSCAGCGKIKGDMYKFYE